MKLAAIYCVWGDCNDLLHHSIENILPVVDGVIVIHSEVSNHGNSRSVTIYQHPKCEFVNWEPNLGLPPHPNETNKRNFGLEIARNKGYDAFINLDGDEFYDQTEFLAERKRFEGMSLNGLVCGVKTYFKNPTLTVGMDHTLVPFLHRLHRNTKFILNSKTYPFAYENGTAHIDPTRRLNYLSGIEMSPIVMHHYSYVRSDFNLNLKIDNSSANLRRSEATIKKDLKNARPGYFCELYHRELTQCENQFNIPEL